LSSISVPIINTGLFAISCALFYMGGPNMPTDLASIFLVFIGFNFILEFLLNAVLSPTIYFIYKTIKNRRPKEN
jgi:hypothetical protein